MTTIESSTKNLLGKLLVDLAHNHLKQWSKQELRRVIKNSSLPLAMPVGDNGWKIGTYFLMEDGNHSYRVKLDGRVIHYFYSRSAAVYYIVLSYLRQFRVADRILMLDMETGKYYDDVVIFKHKINKIKQNDQFKLHLYMTRYHESRNKYNYYRQDLEKTVNSAKYLKLLEDLL